MIKTYASIDYGKSFKRRFSIGELCCYPAYKELILKFYYEKNIVGVRYMSYAVEQRLTTTDGIGFLMLSYDLNKI